MVDYLNERGLRSQVNRPMRIDVVTRLLHNRRYIGEYRYRDIVKEDAIPAIVPKDLFDRVQERLAKNKKALARKKARDEEYLLTTKLFCGKCGASMIGESGTSHTGTVHRYYKCATAKKRKGCDKKSVKKEWIEELVVRETMRMVYDDTVMEALADKLVDFQRRENTDIPLLKKQLAETAQGIENLLNAIQQGILTPSTNGKHLFPAINETYANRLISITKDNITEIERILSGKILFTPGHTTDSISLRVKNLIFCGDAAMNGMPSLHRITIWIENKKEFENSWQVLLSENVEYIYSAHGKRFKSSDLHKFRAKINKIKLYPLK